MLVGGDLGKVTNDWITHQARLVASYQPNDDEHLFGHPKFVPDLYWLFESHKKRRLALGKSSNNVGIAMAERMAKLWDALNG
jgi:hypothetical protein